MLISRTFDRDAPFVLSFTIFFRESERGGFCRGFGGITLGIVWVCSLDSGGQFGGGRCGIGDAAFLWEQRDQLPLERLRASAFRTAWFKSLSFRRDRKRKKLVYFSDESLLRIAEEAENQAEGVAERLDALRNCLARLSAKDLELLRVKYQSGGNLAELARQSGVSPNSLQKATSRLRLVLRQCVESSLSQML